MKKYFKILLLIIIVLANSSCKKWVDYNPKDDFLITDLDYLKTESDYRTMGVSVYTPTQWLNQLVPIGDIASDNAVAGGESATDVLSLQQIEKFIHSPNNDVMFEIWKAAYEGINRANYLHQFKDKNPVGTVVEFAGKEAFYGEIYFLRAYYYFNLVRTFGGVPLFVDKRLTYSDSRSYKRSSKEEVYKQIEIDLKNAITVLPTFQAQKGRITKYAAQALLGKVLLYQNKFDDAATMFENVIVSNAFSLVPNFANIFLFTGENGPESVYEIQYGSSPNYDNWSFEKRGQGNYAVQQCGIRDLSGSSAMPFAPGWSTNLPTQNLANIYAAGDKRKAATILDIEAYKSANTTFNISYTTAPNNNTGLYNLKYLPRKGESNDPTPLNYTNNQRIIRYADVLLMAAEANNKATAANDTKAQTYLNLVRRRAFGDNAHDVSSTGTTLYQTILDERRMELAMEGDRFFDLVRTGKAASVLSTKFMVGKHEVFPIPQFEVEYSGLTQNPNY